MKNKTKISAGKFWALTGSNEKLRGKPGAKLYRMAKKKLLTIKGR